jgi:hypothetical protein
MRNFLAEQKAVRSMIKFMPPLFDIGIVALMLFATFMPERIRNCILDWMFHPVNAPPSADQKYVGRESN